MLSASALEKHKQSFEIARYQTKMNRVKSYLMEQEYYLNQYNSPNTSDVGSVPDSCKNEEPLSSNAFSASISEIIKRKHCQSTTTPSSGGVACHHPKKKQTVPPPLSSIDRHAKSSRPAAGNNENKQRTSSSTERYKRHDPSSQSPENTPPRSKPNIIKKAAHGMHLLQVYIKPKIPLFY